MSIGAHTPHIVAAPPVRDFAGDHNFEGVWRQVLVGTAVMAFAYARAAYADRQSERRMLTVRAGIARSDNENVSVCAASAPALRPKPAAGLYQRAD
jgi:hypothetical protein